MKKLSEMKIAKDAVLSEIEVSSIGGYRLGSNTSYNGPSNPSSITTLVDGDYWGQDGSSGSLFGDSWSLFAIKQGAPSGSLLVGRK